ncbi:Nuclear pore NUP85 [Hyphodiscus hymeniophilus]|uniref:Nuclear pore complex protein Nup85 n=1 Tax=Hyphodiscus hymeniophilus TaxID=353542 RepID=A0A9P6VRZ8_9HELO|nr:Nuclear pore NUP85 [Hyphodiscus hymeniophilus]
MVGFQAPSFSSSPPSTPDKVSSNPFSFGATGPSTTPAGPPPSSAGSFTPAGPPPSSVFGSSMLGGTNAIKPLSYSKQGTFEPSKLQFESPKSSAASFRPSGLANEYQSSPQRGYYAPQDDDEEEESVEQYSEEEEEEQGGYGNQERYVEVDDAMTDEVAQYEDDETGDGYQFNMPGSSARGALDEDSNSDLDLATPEALRDSRLMSLRESTFPTQPKPSMYGKIAKDIYSQMSFPAVTESDDLVLDTEAIVARLYVEDTEGADNEETLQRALLLVSGELTKLWATYDKNTAILDSEEYTTAIGPGPRASKFAKANFIAGLTLQIHHPQVDDSSSFKPKAKPLPRIMLEWIDQYHDPYPQSLEEIGAHRPSPANHHLFWDTILNALLRGKVLAVVNMMKGAGWKDARSDMDDVRIQSSQAGYSGVALANVQKVIDAATQVLSHCPAVYGDWNIRSPDWAMFRMRISQTLADLKRFAEGRDSNFNESVDAAKSSRLNASDTYSQSVRRAESRVPWHIYQRLVTLYGIVMGETDAIIENAQDWCEATVGLLVWWDEANDERRGSLGRSRSGRDSDTDTYIWKLRKAFNAATSGSTDFQVNTLDPVEVALASLLEGENEAVIGFLRSWSGPVSSAVAEVASLAGWLPQAESRDLINMGSLDQDDLDLLGIESSPSKTDGVKDQTLIAYARAVAERDTLSSRGITREGWQLAIALLGRLDSTSRSEEMIVNFLDRFELDSSATVDKLWVLLNDIGMTQHAESTAEKYATDLAENTHKYGEALWYYALAHRTQKVKDVLDLLISLSLVQSTAYPADPELDDHLRRLVSSPRDTLTQMSKMDGEGAELLHKTLSGYATLRKFYTLRDEQLNVSKQSSVSRTQEAAAALLAVISSSDDNITGGLYDEERGAVVNVDFLLALLGEAMVFVNQPGSTLIVSQIETLLKAIEDLQTVGPRVYSACSEFLQTVIASGQGLKGSSPTDMLRKSSSGASGSSFSMVGSSMFASQLKQSMSSSGVLVKGNIKRGWDWRRGISASMKAEDVLRILRLGLAKDLAKAWLIEIDNKM